MNICRFRTENDVFCSWKTYKTRMSVQKYLKFKIHEILRYIWLYQYYLTALIYTENRIVLNYEPSFWDALFFLFCFTNFCYVMLI